MPGSRSAAASTDGTPLHLKANTVPSGTAGTPALLVNYAFDGMTFGYMPDIAALPGAYAKLCYGRGFENGYSTPGGNSLDDTDMVGLSVVPYETEDLKVWLQWNRGMNIFDAPTMKGTYFGDTRARTNLGDIDWYGAGVMGKLDGVGPGTLNWFADVGVSVTRPNDNVSAQFGFQGLLTGSFFNPEAPSSKTGNAIFVACATTCPAAPSSPRVQPRLGKLDHLRAGRRRHVDLQAGHARHRVRRVRDPGAERAADRLGRRQGVLPPRLPGL